MKNLQESFVLGFILSACNLPRTRGADVRDKFTYKNTPEKIFHGCLTYKNCYSPQDSATDQDANCIERADCDHLVSMGGDHRDNNTKDQAVFEMYATSRAWLSIGFSQDKFMGDEYVISCLRPNISRVSTVVIVDDDLKPVVRNSWNFRKPSRGNKNITDMSNIQVVQALFSKSAMYCKFYVKKKFSFVDPVENIKRSVDLNKEYCIITAWSDHYQTEGNEESLDGHNAELNAGGKRACIKPMTAAISRQPSKLQITFMKWHGMCMVSAWVFFVGISNFIGCFYKDIYKKWKICRIKVWFMLHFIFILGAAALIGLGTFFQFLGQWNWERQTKRNLLHFWGGYGVIVIFAFNLLTGFFSGAFSSKCAKRRTPKTLAWLTFFHKYLSHGSHIIAMVVIATTAELHFSEVSCQFGYITLFFLILYWFLSILMEFHKYWGFFLANENKEPQSKNSAFELMTEVSTQETPQNAQTILRLKTYVLISIVFLMATMAVALICLLAWPTEGICYPKETHEFFEERVLERYQKQSLSKKDL